MTRSRFHRIALLIVILLAAMIAILLVLIWRTVRQQQLDWALTVALQQDHCNEVRRLLNAGADANARVNANALRQIGPPSSLQQMLWRIIRPDPSLKTGPPVLFLTVRFMRSCFGVWVADPCLATALLEKGAKVDGRDEQGNTPLLIAVRGGYGRPIVPILLRYGANVNVSNKAGCTPLMYASDNDTIHRLLAWNARLDATDRNGDTALMHAVTDLNDEKVHYLLQHGSDIRIRNHQGWTALSLAYGQQRELTTADPSWRDTGLAIAKRMISLLKAAGAKQ